MRISLGSVEARIDKYLRYRENKDTTMAAIEACEVRADINVLRSPSILTGESQITEGQAEELLSSLEYHGIDFGWKGVR